MIFVFVLVNRCFRRWWRVLDSNQCSLRDGFTARCADSTAPRLSCGNAEEVICHPRSRPPSVRSSRVAATRSRRSAPLRYLRSWCCQWEHAVVGRGRRGEGRCDRSC